MHKIRLSFSEWIILHFFSWLTGGWVRIKKDDPRFKYGSFNKVTTTGDPTLPPTRPWTNRKKWPKFVVLKFTVTADKDEELPTILEGYIACDDVFGRRLMCLGTPIPVEKQVALRMGRESADFFFLTPQGVRAMYYVEFVGYTTVDTLKDKYPAATLL